MFDKVSIKGFCIGLKMFEYFIWIREKKNTFNGLIWNKTYGVCIAFTIVLPRGGGGGGEMVTIRYQFSWRITKTPKLTGSKDLGSRYPILFGHFAKQNKTKKKKRWSYPHPGEG